MILPEGVPKVKEGSGRGFAPPEILSAAKLPDLLGASELRTAVFSDL